MKRYYKNKFYLLLILVLSSTGAIAQERDPFSPTGGGVMSKMKELVSGNEGTQDTGNNFNSGDPLTSAQISSYKVIGTIIADTQKMASVKAINGVSYVVKTGDSLGSEGGKISNIDLEGIGVQTEAREVRLPVSNKVEVPVGNTEKKN